MQVVVGDVVQSALDAGGDRERTAVVPRIVAGAAHGGRGVIHYWHPLT